MLALFAGNVADVDGAHQAGFRVIEDVAMEHPRTRSIELDEKPLGPIHRNMNRVLPGTRAHRHALLVHFLKEEPVQVNGMSPDSFVGDGPQLGLADRGPKG